MESERISESPVSSPDIDYYEECVVAEEDIISSVKLADRSPSVPGKNKNSGRIMKKSKFTCISCLDLKTFVMNWSVFHLFRQFFFFLDRCRNRPLTSKKSSSQLILKWYASNSKVC